MSSNKINSRAIAIGLALNTIFFMMAAYAFAIVAALGFGALASANKLSSNQTDAFFVAVLCGGWLVIKAFCDFAAGLGAGSIERVHTRVNIIVLTCLSLACTAIGVFLVVNIFWPLPTPLWYIFASPVVTLIMPSAGAWLFRRRCARQQNNTPNAAPPIPEVPRN